MFKLRLDKREKRSKNVMKALRLQIISTGNRAKLKALALADDLGMILASTGNTGLCELLAAYSPQAASGRRWKEGTVKTKKGNIRFTIAPVVSDNGPLYLCAAGARNSSMERELFQSSRGIVRILS